MTNLTNDFSGSKIFIAFSAFGVIGIFCVFQAIILFSLYLSGDVIKGEIVRETSGYREKSQYIKYQFHEEEITTSVFYIIGRSFEEGSSVDLVISRGGLFRYIKEYLLPNLFVWLLGALGSFLVIVKGLKYHRKD